MPAHLSAATITFGSATTISADTDVFTQGTFAYAYDWSNTTVTLNGVTFTGSNSTTGGGANVSFGTTMKNNTTAFGSGSGSPWNGLSSSYKNILKGGVYLDYTTATSTTITLNNLTAGQVYAVQYWVNDNRSGGAASRKEKLTSGANTVSLDFNSTNAAGGVGQYVIGYFTADAATQAFTVSVTGSTNVVQMNALQVRSAQPFWSGQTNGKWDTSTANWTGGQSYSALTAAGVTTETFADADGFGNTVSNKTLTVSNGINAGTIAFQNTTAGGAYTLNSGSINLDGDITKTGTGAATINSTIALSAGTHTFSNSSTASDLTLGGAISGTGAITKTGTGTTTLSGSSSNTYTGGTFVNDGELDLNKSGGGSNDATGTGTLTIGDGVGSANSAIVKDLQQGEINNSAPVVVNSDGQLNINGFIETVGSLAGSGNVLLGSTGTLNTGGNNASTTFSGVISGGGKVVKQGTGTMTLSGNSTYTGTTTVSAGTLALTAATNSLSTSTDVTVSSGATLSAAANTNQTLHSLAGAGTVTVDTGGNLTIDTTSTAFTGTLNLNGATLTLDGTSLGNGMTLNVTGNSVIDFQGNSTLNLASLTLAAGATLEIKNWVAGQDFFFDSGTVNGSAINSISPGTGTLANINFDGYTNSTGPGGTPTGWRSWSSPGNQISPVPEPAAYGAVLLGSGVLLAGLSCRRRNEVG